MEIKNKMIKINEKQVKELLLDQKLHTEKLKLRWLTEEMRNFNDITIKATSTFIDFYKAVNSK